MLRAFYILMGVAAVANGLWMMVAAENWYHNIPAEVHDTGPYNGHFIRDIGLAYLISGLAFLWSAANLARCWVVHIGNTLFAGGHAALHMLDIVTHRLPPSHWIVDAAPVLVPGAIMLALCVPQVWRWANPSAAEAAAPR